MTIYQFKLAFIEIGMATQTEAI